MQTKASFIGEYFGRTCGYSGLAAAIKLPPGLYPHATPPECWYLTVTGSRKNAFLFRFEPKRLDIPSVTEQSERPKVPEAHFSAIPYHIGRNSYVV